MAGVPRRYVSEDERRRAEIAQQEIQRELSAGSVASNLASGVAQIPTDIISGATVVGSGIGSALNAVRADDERQAKMTYLQRLADDFTDSMFAEGQDAAMAKVEDHLEQVQLQVLEQNPNASYEQLNKFMEKYQNGDDFVDYFTSLMSPGFRLGIQGNRYANQVFGVDKRPDQQTETDELIQLAGQALIPGKIATAPTKYLTKMVIDRTLTAAKKSALKEVTARAAKVANTKAGKVARFVGESVVPMTSPYSAGRVAANIAGGAVVGDVTRYLQDKPSVIGEAVYDDDPDIEFIQTPEGVPIPSRRPETVKPDTASGEPPHGHGVNIEAGIEEELAVTGMGAAAIFGIPAIRRAILGQARQQAANTARNAGATVPTPPSTQGPSLHQQAVNKGLAMPPTPSHTELSGLADINMPAKKAVNKFKPTADDTAVDLVDYEMSAGTNISRNDAFDNLYKAGVLPNHAKTIPFREVEQRFGSLDPVKQQKYIDYANAIETQQDVDMRINSLQTTARHAQNDYNMAIATNDAKKARAAQKEYQDATRTLQDTINDVAATRPSNEHWSKADRQRHIREGQADPDVMGVVNDHIRVTDDALDTLVANGIYTRQHATVLKANRNFYFPLTERAYADLFEGSPLEGTDVAEIARRGLMFKDKVKNMIDWRKEGGNDTEFYVPKHERDITGTSGKVNRPLHPMISLKRHLRNVTGEIVTNNARRNVIDQMKVLPGMVGTELKPFMIKVGNRQIHQISPEQFRIKEIRGQIEKHNADSNGNRLVRVIRDGQYEFWQFSSKALANSLEFNPTMAVPLMNMARKGLQMGTTGWVQVAFGPLALIRDVGVAATTANTKRYKLGRGGTWASKLYEAVGFNAEEASQLAGRFDPSVALTPLQGMTYKVIGDLTEAAAQKIAKDLRTNSGVLNAIAQVHPNGQAWLTNAGRWMQKSFDDSAYGTYKYNARTGLTMFIDGSKIVDDYDLSKRIALDKTVSAASMPLRIAARTLKYTAQTLQEAMRLGFFAENYKPNMSQKDLKLLLQATNNLTGDLSRSSKSKIIQGITSTIPFSNATLQGTRHMFNAAIPASVAKKLNRDFGTNILDNRVDDFWIRMGSYVGMPVLMSSAFLQDWGNEAVDWWYNQTPDWKRANGIPFPNYDALEYYFEKGEWPPFHPNYVNIMPLAPDFSAFKSAFTAGLRAFGLIGPANQTQPYSMMGEIGAGLGQYISFMTPSAITAPFAAAGYRVSAGNALTGDPLLTEITQPAFQGGNPDMMDFNSYIPQWYHDVASAVFGTAGSIQMQAVNAGVKEYAKSENLIEALYQYGRIGWAETKEKAPEIEVPVLFDATNRYYVSNPEGNYVHETETDLAPVFGQHQVEIDKESGTFAEGIGNTPPPKINDPFLYGISMFTYDMIKKKGTYKAATTAYSELRKQLAILEGNRTDKTSKQYEVMRNRMILAQQSLNKQRSQILYETEKRMQDVFGQQFQQQYGTPLTYKSLSAAVGKNVRAQ